MIVMSIWHLGSRDTVLLCILISQSISMPTDASWQVIKTSVAVWEGVLRVLHQPDSQYLIDRLE